MASLTSPLGPYFNLEGTITPGSVLQFLDPNTDNPKTAYADEALTVPADNPIAIGSDGRTPYQVFLSQGQYKVRQWALISNITTPIFPDDYTFQNEWIEDGITSNTVSGEGYFVDSIAALSALDPTQVPTVVGVLGYYSADDLVEPRFYYWDELSVASANGGSVIPSDLVGTGRWILKADGPIVDVRWFGALPNTGYQCNSAINAAITYANSGNGTPKTLYFPSGVYRVTAGSSACTSSLKMDHGVFFYNLSESDYVFSVYNYFDIRITQSLKHPASIGEARFTFASNSVGYPQNLYINAAWFTNGASDALIYAGQCPILVETALTASPSDNSTITKIRFGVNGSLNFVTNKLTTIQAIEAKNGQQVISGAGLTYPAVQFQNMNVNRSWLSSDTVRFAMADNAKLILDTNLSYNPALTSVNLSQWDALVGNGGELIVDEAQTITIPNNNIGTFIRCDGKVTQSYSHFDNFILDDSDSVRGYIRSCIQNNAGQVEFEGKKFTFNVNVDDLGDIVIRNVEFNGGFQTNNSGPAQNITLENSRITGDMTGNFVNLGLNNCIINYPAKNLSITSMAFNNAAVYLNSISTNTISGIQVTLSTNGISADSIALKNSTITSASGSLNTAETFVADLRNTTVINMNIQCDANALNPYHAVIKDCTFVASYIKFVGSLGYMYKINITDNDFQANGINPYYPIDIDSMVVSTGTILNCYIANNTPSVDQITWDALPTTGTVIRQTHQKFIYNIGSVTLGGNTERPLIMDKTQQKYWFTPYFPVNFDVHYTNCSYSRLDVASGGSGTNWPLVYLQSRNYLGTQLYLLATGGHLTMPEGNGISVEVDVYKH